MTDTDEIFMEELKQEFMESVGGNLVQMTAMLKEDKYEEIAKIAHDIKGTAGIFGLDQGTEIAKELQFAAQDKQTKRTGELIQTLTRYMKDNGIIS